MNSNGKDENGDRHGGHGLALVGSALLLSVLATACGPELVPTVPTFAADIRPLMIARCVRCHGGGGKENIDPLQKNPVSDAPLYGYFDRLEDQGTCADGSRGDAGCKRGLLYFATLDGGALLKTNVKATDDTRMPPPPSSPLSDAQVTLLDNWLAESPPM
jgi:hypothetical protein